MKVLFDVNMPRPLRQELPGDYVELPASFDDGMKVPRPFPCQGSKRNLAPAILGYFPKGVATLIRTAGFDHGQLTHFHH